MSKASKAYVVLRHGMVAFVFGTYKALESWAVKDGKLFRYCAVLEVQANSTDVFNYPPPNRMLTVQAVQQTAEQKKQPKKQEANDGDGGSGGVPTA